jgi:hypothetical protein
MHCMNSITKPRNMNSTLPRRGKMGGDAFAIVTVMMLLLAFTAAISLSSCRKREDYGKTALEYLGAWQQSDYQRAYDLLCSKLKETKSFDEFKGELELINLQEFSEDSSVRNQGLAYMRFKIRGTWKDKGPDLAGIKMLLIKEKKAWKIGATEDIFKGEEIQTFSALQLMKLEGGRVMILRLDSAGKPAGRLEMSYPQEQEVDYQMSHGEKLTICKENLKQLSLSLERYSIDHHGSYPAALSELVPTYLDEIPRCPGGGSYSYQREVRLKTWVLKCRGCAHNGAGLRADFPALYPVKGIVEN